MSTSGIPPPEFFFKCHTCGEYPVTENTARRHLTKELRRKLDDALEGDERIFVLTFENGCPRCKPVNPDAVVELSAMRPKKPKVLH